MTFVFCADCKINKRIVLVRRKLVIAFLWKSAEPASKILKLKYFFNLNAKSDKVACFSEIFFCLKQLFGYELSVIYQLADIGNKLVDEDVYFIYSRIEILYIYKWELPFGKSQCSF